MGCGSSTPAATLPIVPAAAVDPTRPHKVQVASLGPPAGAATASFKSGPQAAGLASKRGNLLEDDSQKLTTAALDAANAPPGSQIAGLNYCTPEFFPTHMEQCWNHYARPPDYKLIDKSGLKLMAEDAVNSFLDSARKWIQSDNPRWNPEKVETKLNLLRGQYLPGAKIEDSIVISTHFLAHELKFQAGDDSKSSGVTKPCFFLHFQRAHRMLFSFTAGQTITLERELIVQKLNKQGVDRANKGLKSLTANKSSSSGLSSQKAVKSVKASSRQHKSKAKTASSSTAKQQNMFGELDFGPSIPESDGTASIK